MTAVGTMKRKLKWLAIVLAVLLLGFGPGLLLSPRDRITAESWHKIRLGMTEDEVAEILGGPGMNFEEALAERDRREKERGIPINIRDQEFEVPKRGHEKGENIFAKDRAKLWISWRGYIIIELDQDNLVCWKRFQGMQWTGGILDRLRDWLGW